MDTPLRESNGGEQRHGKNTSIYPTAPPYPSSFAGGFFPKHQGRIKEDEARDWIEGFLG